MFKDRVLNVVFVGDSITMGASLGDRDADAPPVKAAEVLRAKLPGVAVTMMNDESSTSD